MRKSGLGSELGFLVPCLLGQLDDPVKALWIIDGDLTKHLTVEPDVRSGQTSDQATVSHAAASASRIDPRDPQSPVITFDEMSVLGSVDACADHGFLDAPPAPAASTSVSLGEVEPAGFCLSSGSAFTCAGHEKSSEFFPSLKYRVVQRFHIISSGLIFDTLRESVKRFPSVPGMPGFLDHPQSTDNAAYSEDGQDHQP